MYYRLTHRSANGRIRCGGMANTGAAVHTSPVSESHGHDAAVALGDPAQLLTSTPQES